MMASGGGGGGRTWAVEEEVEAPGSGGVEGERARLMRRRHRWMRRATIKETEMHRAANEEAKTRRSQTRRQMWASTAPYLDRHAGVD